MNCRSAETLFSSYVEDEISQEERRHLEAHLMGCRRCSVGLREIRATLAVLQRETSMIEPSAHFDEDVFAKIRSGEGLRPTGWELVRELLLPIRLKPAVLAGVGISAMAAALAVSPIGQSFLRAGSTAIVTRTTETTPRAMTSAPSSAPAPVVAEREVAPEPRTPSPVRSGSLIANAASTSPATQDSILDGAVPSTRYNDEIINDRFYLDRGAPGQDPSVVPVNTSQDDGVYIVF